MLNIVRTAANALQENSKLELQHRITTPLSMASVMLMKACYHHPFYATFGDAADQGPLTAKLARTSRRLAWELLVIVAEGDLKRVRKVTGKSRACPTIVEKLDRQLQDIRSFTPHNHLNSKQPEVISDYIWQARNPKDQLQRIEELFAERHILPAENFRQKLFVHCVFTRRGEKFAPNADYRFVAEIPAGEMLENGLLLQERAHCHVTNALNSLSFYEYLYYLNLAAPYYRAAELAFRGAKKRFASVGDDAGCHNAEAERYVSEEWYVICAVTITSFGESIVSGPFTHLAIHKAQSHLYGVSRRTDDLMTYLTHNDVLFPVFCKRAWQELVRLQDFERLLTKSGSVEQDMERLDQLRLRYLQLLGSTMDPLSSQLLSKCLETEQMFSGMFS